MRRLSLYLGALSWGARLQLLTVVIILGYYAWFDFERGRWPVTVGIIAAAWVIGWLLKPLMIAFPRQSQLMLSAFGIVFLAAYVLAHQQWWWRTLLAHYVREWFFWQDISCGYWFLSERRLRAEPPLDDFGKPRDEADHSRPNIYAG